MDSLHIVPCTIKQANRFVNQLHRHHKPVVSARIALAVADESGSICGVALVGRPVARHQDNGWTLEVNRVATNGTPNACSILYGAAWKATRAIGYTRLITYTLPEEGGASLRATGWKLVGERKSHQWSSPSRPRKENPIYPLTKSLWEVTTGSTLPFDRVTFPVSLSPQQETLFESCD